MYSWQSKTRDRIVLRNQQIVTIPNYVEVEKLGLGHRCSIEASYSLVPMSKIIHLMERATKIRVDAVRLDGPIINLTAARAEEFARAYNMYLGNKKIPIEFAELLPIANLSESVLLMLKLVKDLELSFQSTNPKLRRYFSRKYKHASYREILRKLRGHFIEPTLSICVGIPGDDKYSLLETLRAAYALEPARVKITHFTAKPGTFFYDNRQKYKIKFEDDDDRFIVRGHYSASALELRYLLEICKMSAKSYNHWNKLARRQG